MGKVPNNRALVNLSGGMDSTTLLAYAIDRFGKDNVIALAFDYGQKHSVEVVHSGLIASDHYRVEWQLVRLPRIFGGAGSSLIDDDINIEVVGSYDELATRFGSQPTVVPNRNMNLIAMAVTIALTKGAGYVLVGAHAGDAANYHYPDCRPGFNGAMSAAIEIATEGAVQLEAPFNWMSKADIVKKAVELEAPLHLTHSCYRGMRPACGECATCLERLDAFHAAKVVDPIPYAIHIDWPDDCWMFPTVQR